MSGLTEALRAQGAREFGGGGNRPFFLDSPSAWVVLEGTVDLFLVRKREGRPEGAHLPFQQVPAGEILLGLPDDGEFSVLAVGDADARLLERQHPALHGPDAGPVRCEHTGHRFLCFRELDQGPVPDHRQVAAPADQEGRQAGQFAPTVTAPEPEDRDRCKHLP